MSSQLLITSFQYGLMYSILAIGLYISYKILDIADLSVEGTFPLGAFVFAALATKSFNPYASMLVCFAAGMIGGLITALLYIKLNVTPLLAGILTLNLLYSINLKIGFSQSNISIDPANVIFKYENVVYDTVIMAVVVIIVKILLDLFLKTELGYLLVSTGDNEKLVQSLGQSSNRYKILGLMISNGLVALSGSLVAQHQGFADSQLGIGIIVYALASIIIGDTIMRNSSKLKGTTRAILGAIIYRVISGIAIDMPGLSADDLRATTSVIIILFIAYNEIKFGNVFSKLMKKNEVR